MLQEVQGSDKLERNCLGDKSCLDTVAVAQAGVLAVEMVRIGSIDWTGRVSCL